MCSRARGRVCVSGGEALSLYRWFCVHAEVCGRVLCVVSVCVCLSGSVPYVCAALRRCVAVSLLIRASVSLGSRAR